MEGAESVQTLAKMFGMSEESVRRILRKRKSPGFKTGGGKTSPWMCFPSKFEKFLLDQSTEYKS